MKAQTSSSFTPCPNNLSYSESSGRIDSLIFLTTMDMECEGCFLFIQNPYTITRHSLKNWGKTRVAQLFNTDLSYIQQYLFMRKVEPDGIIIKGSTNLNPIY